MIDNNQQDVFKFYARKVAYNTISRIDIHLLI